MSSKISTVYDYYITQLGTLYSSKQRIPNPYSLEDNVIQFLRDGWGLRLGSQSFFSSEMCHISEQYSFVIVLCREIVRLDSEATTFDTVGKNIKEDIFTLREFFYDVDNINSNIDKITLGPTDPLGFFIAGKNNFLYAETTIQTIIRESI